MSQPQRGRSYSTTQHTSPYQNTNEQEVPDAEQQSPTASSRYSQTSYNENTRPPQEPDEQPAYYPSSVVGDGYTSAHNSTQAYYPDRQQSPPYSYAPQGYNNQYMTSQNDYQTSQNNYRGSKDYYRGSYDHANMGYQNSPYNPPEYNPNVYASSPQNNPPVDPEFDIYSDFNNLRPRTHDFDESNNSGAQTPTPRNNNSPGGVRPESMMDMGGYPKSYTDQLTQGLIDEPSQKPKSQLSRYCCFPRKTHEPGQKRSPRCCCCSRKTCVIITFIIIVIIGITTYFVFPRIPHVEILDAQPKGSPTISLEEKRLLMNFNLRIQIQNPDNWVPIRFNEIDAKVYDVNTLNTYDRPIATGNVTNYALPPRQTSILNFPLTVDYIGNTTSDPTILDFKNACTPPDNGAKATTLNVRADITLSLWGLSWLYKPKTSVGLSNLVCPYSQISQYLSNLNNTDLNNILGG